MTAGPTASITDLLLGDAFALAFFVGFFALALIAVLFPRHDLVRRLYVGLFFAGLVAVSVSLLQLYPLADLQKFSWTASDEEVVHKAYVVDESGDRLRLDRRLVPTYAPPPPPYTNVAATLATGCTEREAGYVGGYLLQRAAEYRERLADGGRGPLELVDFPRHHVEDRWTASELDEYGDFTAITVYRETISFEPDGYAVRSRNETRVRTIRGAPGGANASGSIPDWVDCSAG